MDSNLVFAMQGLQYPCIHYLLLELLLMLTWRVTQHEVAVNRKRHGISSVQAGKPHNVHCVMCDVYGSCVCSCVYAHFSLFVLFVLLLHT